jgi:hypothetical protein
MDLSKALWGKMKQLESAKTSGGIGYSEQIVLTYDGNTDGVEFNDEGGALVKLSTIPLDLNNVTKFVLSSDPALAAEYGAPDTIEVTEGFTVVRADDGTQVILFNDDEAIVSADKEDMTGTFAAVFQLDGKVATWISRVEFEETIHPIDPKFIPDKVVSEEMLSLAILNGIVYAANDSGGKNYISYTSVNGISGAAYTAADIANAVAYADKIRFIAGENTEEIAEVSITTKAYTDGTLTQFGLNFVSKSSGVASLIHMVFSLTDGKIEVLTKWELLHTYS